MAHLTPRVPPGALAVVGMHARFPGAAGVDAFWRNLHDGVESLGFFTDEELLNAGVDAESLADPRYVRAGRPLEGIEEFDAGFFGYSPREAEGMDPQHRLFLEGAWSALEDAGYTSGALGGAIGVFAGSGLNSYLLANLAGSDEVPSPLESLSAQLGSDKDFLATRVSYHLDLKGPSVVVQTGCSTSLVAIAQACFALNTYQCDMALAGGVSIRVPQQRGYLYTEDGIASPDGHCRPFDADGRGTSFGSGIGVVVLKRLEDAMADGDQVRAVVLGAAVNNDGARKVGYTAPSVDGQAEVIIMAQSLAGVDPETVTYVEGHGTATPLGDPIEVAALTQAFRQGSDRRSFCALGSVKGNIGHLDTASGVAGFIKTVLALERRKIPPTLFFRRPNPETRLADSPFYVNAEPLEWETNGLPRRAGVSSFGMGGTNAHLVLQEAPQAPPSSASRPVQLLVMSAKSETALDAVTANLATYLREHPDVNLADVAHTLQVGREVFDHRRAITCTNADDARALLESPNELVRLTRVQGRGQRSVAFMFPGQGAQYLGMGRELYETEPYFRQQVDWCSDILLPELGIDLREVMWPSEPETRAADDSLSQTSVTQPALFTIEFALAHLWIKWGVRPTAMIGHSVGELVAACLAGVFRPEDALAIVAARGRLLQELPAGAMLAVPLSADDVQRRLTSDLELAAINTPELVTVSGPAGAIDRLEEELGVEGVLCRRVQVSHAFHSSMMEPAQAALAEEVARTPMRPPEIPFVSGVTGTWITPQQAGDPRYWARQMRETVRFADGIETLLDEPGRVLLEVGPGSALTVFSAPRVDASAGQVAIPSMRHRNNRAPDVAVLLKALGQLWLSGVSCDWTAFYEGEHRHRISLPTYPFDRQRHWIEPTARVNAAVAGRPEGSSSWYSVTSWKRTPLLAGADAPRLGGRLLMFVDSQGFWDPLARSLRESGRDVVTVRPGAGFACVAPDAYTVDPTSREDYQRLIGALAAAGTPDRVLHLWLATPEAPVVEDALAFGFFSLYHLADALNADRASRDTLITMVTAGAHGVTADEVIPQVATVLGACRVLPLEQPNLSVHNVDVDGVQGTNATSELVELIEAVVEVPDREPVVAYRGGDRWVPGFEEIPLPLPEGLGGLRERGVYLITGGFGGVGRTLARFLAERVRARLVLCSRTGLGRHRPDGDLPGGRADTERDRRELVAALEAAGAEVVVVEADVTDRAAMKNAIEATKARFGQLHGVIHAAGVAGAGLLRAADEPVSFSALAPKIEGTSILAELCGPEVDFVALCSAVMTSFGAMGQADYCAGNAFMDAFSVSRNGESPRFVSIGWDTWAEVGMAVDAEVPSTLRGRQKEILREGLTCQEGVDVFRAVLASELPHVLVSKTPLERRTPGLDGSSVAQLVKPADRSDVSETREDGREPAESAPDSEHVAAPVPGDEIVELVAGLYTQFLGIESPGHEDSFFALGGNSLLATQILSRIRTEYPDAEVSLRRFFAQPTIAGLVDAIRESRGPETSAPALPLAEQLRLAGRYERPAVIRGYLRRQIAELADRPEADIHDDESFERFDEVLLAAHLTWVLRRDLGLPLYPHEIRARNSIGELAVLVDEELDRPLGSPAPAATDTTSRALPVEAKQILTDEISAEKNEKMAFVLSAPRSGSTLLRLMLSAHPLLFCPPELFLLDNEGMRAWSDDPFSEFYRDGLVRTFMALNDIDLDDARSFVDDLVERDESVQEVYGMLQRGSKGMLVDKTPTYALSMSALHRSQRLFQDPVYIFLVRHPYAMIDSFVRNRLDRIRRLQGDPYALGEKYWVQAASNMLEFSEQLGSDQFRVVRFEDLVSAPEITMRELCEHLGVPFEVDVLDPYGKGRMLGGPGDPHIFDRKGIDASLGEVWKDVTLPRPVGRACERLCGTLGYDLEASDGPIR